MKKRPLCAICILYLVIQSLRVLFFGVGEMKPSALEKLVSDDARVNLTGTVYRIEEKEKVTAFYLKDNAVSVTGQNIKETNILVYYSRTQNEKQIKIGNRIEINGEAQTFDQARNPGNFDQRSYYRRQGIHVLIWADDMIIRSGKTAWPGQLLSEVRQNWNEILLRHLGEYYGGTMSAILLGEKGGLDEKLKSIYQKSGISHILAISGLHMTFLGMGMYRAFRRAGIGFSVSGTAGIILLILYSFMIGAGVSSIRALLMFLVKIFAEITGRDYDLPTSLALSAAVLCGWQPLYLTDAGFLLSYGAILGIAVYEPVFSALFGCDRTVKEKKEKGSLRQYAARVRRWAARGLVASIAVNLILLGPLLYFYFEIPPYSVILNLIVIPVMPAAMCAGVIGSILALISDAAGGAVLQICKVVLAGYDLVCGISSDLPGSRFIAGKPDAWWLFAYYLVLAGLYLIFLHLRKRKDRELQKIGDSEGTRKDLERRWRKLCKIPGGMLLIFAVGMAALCRSNCRSGEGIQVTAVDVGQGDCFYVRGISGRFLIDGGSSNVSDVSTYRIEPCLLSEAADTLDYVFVTHGDTDHISGIEEMLSNQSLGVRIRNLVLPPVRYHDEMIRNLAESARKYGTRVIVMKAGDRITDGEGGGKNRAEAGEMTLTCLGPDDSEDMEPGNEASLILKASYGAFDMLFTGDVEGEGEKLLIESGRLDCCDVLKAAHHGSKNSGSEAFLGTVQPRITLISAGVDNRYGHPHEETLERLADAGSSIYSTQKHGAVTVWSDGISVKVKKHLN